MQSLAIGWDKIAGWAMDGYVQSHIASWSILLLTMSVELGQGSLAEAEARLDKGIRL
jgi:hypothetical protein